MVLLRMSIEAHGINETKTVHIQDVKVLPNFDNFDLQTEKNK